VKLAELIECKYLLYWSSERVQELFNSWEDEQKTLRNYFDRFENFAKPHFDELIAARELYKIKTILMTILVTLQMCS